jgi:SagB-type dehydrogenase family enzyme
VQSGSEYRTFVRAGVSHGRIGPARHHCRVMDDSETIRYHEATKHSPESVSRSRHQLDWSIKPLPFKIYRDLEAVEPPADIRRLCLFSNGVLRRRRSDTGETYGFRAAATTGALYHVELYLATSDRDGLPAGLYQYGAHDGLLRRLRSGDVRGSLSRAAGEYEPIASAPLVFVLSSTFWRNSWKYQARAYRHAYWDGGAIVANLLALVAEDGQPASVVMAFADDQVNRILGLDGVHETATAIVAVGDGASQPPAATDLPELSLPTEPLSPREVHYPDIERVHRASSFSSEGEVAAWRARAGGNEARHSVPALLAEARIEGGIADVIERRRSARSFADMPLMRSQLEAVLEFATRPIPGDSFAPLPVEPLLIVNSVEGLERGTYRGDLRPIRQGDARRAAGQLALWQELGAEAAVNVYFLADLESIQQRLGERGYRIAQMAGGICGGRLELAATGLGLAATGLTFFDDAVTGFFEPAAERRQVIYLEAVGTR